MQSNSREMHAFKRGTTIVNYRQISIVDRAELHQIAQRLDLEEILPGTIADNICTEGLPDLTALPLMTRLMFPSGASIMTGGENNPCTIAGGMVQARYGTLPHKFPKAAIHLRGITGWVERPGVIRVGDLIEVVGLH
jgi:MOSC domain-containing protein YiiM